MNHVKTYFGQAGEIARSIDIDAVEAMAEALASVRERGGRLFFIGAGGSAGNCGHAVNDFRKLCGIEAYAPTDNVSELTARTNDEGWETVFVEWLKVSRLNRRDGVFVFSVGGGNPSVADTNNLVLRGFSFKLGDGDHRSDILAESAPVHFARTLDQMLAFLEARIPGPDGKPDMAKVKAFSAANPETLNQANYVAARPLPGSFAGTTYWGVHAFPATNSRGETRFIKFKIAPVGGNVTLTDVDARTKTADFLHDDLENRIAAADVRFNVMALLDRPGDPVMDVTIRWLDEDAREAVRLGTIVITAVEANEACDASIFNPANLAEGIGHPPDQIFAARRAAYTISLAKRR